SARMAATCTSLAPARVDYCRSPDAQGSRSTSTSCGARSTATPPTTRLRHSGSSAGGLLITAPRAVTAPGRKIPAQIPVKLLAQISVKLPKKAQILYQCTVRVRPVQTGHGSSDVAPPITAAAPGGAHHFVAGGSFAI